jgi:hypothetical protein
VGSEAGCWVSLRRGAGLAMGRVAVVSFFVGSFMTVLARAVS